MSQPSPPRTSPWSPLRHPTFRALWIATLASNVGTWLQSVGAAWLMTSLTPSSTMVALVQAATSLPMFLLSLPAGALADVLDRRRILLATQSWMLLSAAALGQRDQGPVLVMIEYRVDPERAAEFAAAMTELRRVRLRGGAMQWGLFNDADEPGIHTEMFLVSSWMEHMRQHERITVADEEIRLRAGGFHTGPEPPAVRHLIAEHR